MHTGTPQFNSIGVGLGASKVELIPGAGVGLRCEDGWELSVVIG
jgi:hypothetical protein